VIASPHLYAVAIGSNRRHGRFGKPAGVIEAAIARLDAEFDLFDAAPIILNKAVGGAGRDFANSVVLVRSHLDPLAMLAALKQIEREFGRRPGRRWGERVLDLDLAAWDGPRLRTLGLTIPHPRLAERDFVLGPLAAVAPAWRIAGPFSVRHLLSRLGKRLPNR
jgi:2-amino-4-hydroxy-6-hydroxymethyldihydropteridine diphosphokinase